MNTRETIEELLRRIASGDPTRIAELYADEVDWMLDWPEGDYAETVPWIRHRSTRAGVAEHFRLIAEHHVPEESSATVTAVLVDGADAVVMGEFRNTARERAGTVLRGRSAGSEERATEHRRSRTVSEGPASPPERSGGRSTQPTGRRYVAAFALHLTVENGLVTRHHVYEDSLAVARAFDAARPVAVR